MKSMTGYGRATARTERYEITAEVHSVNHRFLETSVRLPRSFSYLEEKLKEQVQQKISRGKVEVTLTMQTIGAKSTVVEINHDVVTAYLQAVAAENALLRESGFRRNQIMLGTAADENGNACALWAQPQIIGKIDAWGRAKVSAAAKEPVRIAADVVVVAIGQGIETRHFEQAGMSVKRGNLAALPDGMVSDLPGVFAGGDCVTGPATVIRAIAAGKVAAANIDNYLGFNHLISVDVDIPAAISEDKHHCARVNLGEKDAQERKDNFEHIECGMTAQEAAQECGRCLRCDHYGYGIFKGGRAAIW